MFRFDFGVKHLLFLRVIFFFVIAVACGKAPSGALEGFQSRSKDGGRIYLFSHYEVLNKQVRNPFQQGGELTDAELSITREMLDSIGQCLYEVQSDRPLSAHTPAGLQEMLSRAQPLTQEQKYVPLTQVYDEVKGLRDIYGHRMPWYYHYVAIGGTFAVLNGLFDIATHDAQAEAIKIADEYIKSDAYKQQAKRLLGGADDLFKDMTKLDLHNHKLIVKSGKAEHKLEELFGRFLYVGRDAKLFGRKVNLNPLWALKEKAGKKLVPLVQKVCTAMSSIMCVAAITTVAGTVLAAAAPLAYFATNKLNEHVHREEEQNRLLDIVGDWDSFRTFTILKPADMNKLKKKMHKLSAKGTHDCPPADTLASIYSEGGRYY